MTRSVHAALRYALPALIAVGLLLRIPGLSDSFYGDEAFSVLRDSLQLVTPTEDRFRPVFFSLLYLWRQVGFTTELGMRLLPLAFGVAQIPLAHAVGTRIGSRGLALTWAALIAGSPLLVEFSQELRMYSLVATIALAQAWIVTLLLDSPTLARWAAFVAVAVLGIYTHLHYWMFLGGVALLLVIERRALGLARIAITLAVIAILYLPDVPAILHFAQLRSGKYVVHLASALPKLVAAFFVGFDYFALGEQSQGRPITAGDLARNAPLVVLAAIPILVALPPLFRAHRVRPLPRPLVFAHSLFTVPVLLVALATFVTKQYWAHPKYCIFAAPFLLLFVAYGLVLLERAALRVAAGIALTLVCGIALSRLWDPRHFGRREDWRGAAEALRAQPDAAIVGLRAEYGLLDYYWPGAAQRLAVVDIAPEVGGTLDSLARATADRSRILYVRWDTIRLEQDPGGDFPRALEAIAEHEADIELNPRLRIEEWRKKAH